MLHYRLPSQLTKGARVILYGAGKVGMSYSLQMADHSDYSLLFVADRDWRRLGVEDPERLRGLGPEEYDAVVVAIMDPMIAEKARAYLLELGVPGGKIVIPDAFPLWPGSSLALAELLREGTIPRYELECFQVYGEKDVRFFENLIQEIKGDPHWESTRPMIQSILVAACDEVSSLLYRILYRAERFDPELLEAYVRWIRSVGDNNERYWHTLDLNAIAFHYPQCLYDNFYLDRRELFRDICKGYGWTITPPAAPAQKNKILMLVQRLYGGLPGFAPALTSSCMANALHDLGHEVFVFVLDEGNYDGKTTTLPHSGFSSKKYSESNRSLFHADISIRYFEADSIRQQMQDVLDAIAGLHPGSILDLSDDMAAISYLYYQKYPVLLFPLRRPSVSTYYHKIFYNDAENAHMEKTRFRTFEDTQLIPGVCCPFDFTDSHIAYTRESFGLSDADFLIVTVGSRLHLELDDELIAILCNMLELFPKWKWILVGNIDWEHMNTRYSDFLKNRQIIPWGFEASLSSLYQICTVYLNPPRIGGGTTIAQAMDAGLPVVNIDDPGGAGNALAGLDQTVGKASDELKQLLGRLYQDQAFYEEMSREMKRRAANFSPKAAAKVISAAIAQFQSDWAKNKEQPV